MTVPASVACGMVGTRGLRLGVMAGLLAIVPTTPGIADDEDVPKLQPALVWERAVACDSAAELAADDGPPRRCNIAVDGDALYLHEYTAPGALGEQYRLTRFDISTGDVLWVREGGPSSILDAYADIVVIGDKSHFEVYDAATGALRFRREGSIEEVNRYGTVLLSDGITVIALDPHTGDELWAKDGALGAFCRDIVILVAPRTDETGTEPFLVVDQFTGDERWTSDDPFDPRTDEISCGFGPYVYTADGAVLREWDAHSGWINWSTSIPGAADIELYREVALVRSDADSVVAVERETGEVLWTRPAAEVGTAVSIIGRVREDAEGVFTLLPETGDIVNHTSLGPGAKFEVVDSSDTRVVIATGSVVTSYGMNDLGTSWQLDVGGNPDEFAVGGGYLAVRAGPLLRGYG